jgi:hypothetical protein
MKLQRLLLVTGLLLALAGAAYLAQEAEPTGARVGSAAEKLLSSLNDTQKAKAALAFDSKERINWNFVPMQDKERKPTRKGLPLAEMTADQKELAKGLVRSCTSMSGYGKAITIMSLESILRDLEKSGAMVRDPQWYFFTLFGTPSKTGKWGFRIEGHHLSLNFTLDRGQVIGFTPCFFGANPAELKDGPRKGEQVLPEAENTALKLADALNESQRKTAIQDKQFLEIEQGKDAPHVGDPVGLAASQMNASQKELLLGLIKGYLSRVPVDVAAVEMAEVEKAGLDKIYFAMAQDKNKKGNPHSYRVHGPTFLIEFLNVQNDSAGNPANHIHSVWRKLKGDFGLAAAK